MRFYATTVNEAQRLTTTADGRLELLRTQELLRRHLPPAPARILDVGGGPGTHARWLTGDGYQVHLVDPVPRHIKQAGEVAGCTVELGDARQLTAADDSCDVVLLLGPLYHLIEAEDRRQALREANRVLCPGGLLAAAGISCYASLFEHAAFSHLHTPHMRESVTRVLQTKIHDGKRAFTQAYFHSGPELEAEVTAAGFAGARVFGIEGPAWSMLAATERHTGVSVVETPLFQSALAAAQLAEPYPELLAASSHMLAVARRE